MSKTVWNLTDIDKVQAEPCHCVRCGECSGNGTVRSRPSLADFDLEICEGCGGSGIVETCARCEVLAYMEHDLP